MNSLTVRSGLQAGMKNPASENCEKMGGVSQILNIPNCGGEVGLCVFPSVNVCEEWALMRGECNPAPTPLFGSTR